MYADHPDEAGGPAQMAWAEFIRVQLEKARLIAHTRPWREKWYREIPLYGWTQQWRAELPTIPEIVYGPFSRGFIDRVSITSERPASEIRIGLTQWRFGGGGKGGWRGSP